MNVPEIKESIAGYKFEWAEEKIVIYVTHIKQHSDGSITSEIKIETTREDFHPHLYQTQFNLASGPTRERTAKILTAKYKDFLDMDAWGIIIEQLCVKTIELIRRGEPVLELWTNDDVKAPEYILDPVLMKDMPTIIYGAKGANKSTLAMAIYTCLALPWADNGLGLYTLDKATNTLWLDWETEPNICQYNARILQKGMDLPEFSINYRRCNLPLAEDVEQIQNHIANTGAKVIIIDSLGAAAGGDLKKPEQALSFFSALRKLKLTSLIIAQTSKDEETNQKRIYGSVYFEYYARSIFELCKNEPTNKSDYDIALFHRWSNLTRLHDPLGFRLHYNGHSLSIDATDVDYKEYVKKVKIQPLIIELLKSGAMSVNDIENATGASSNVISATLTKMKKRGEVVNLARGLWGLKSGENVVES